MVLTPRPGFMPDHTEKFMSAVTQREPFFCIFLHPLSIGGFVVLLQFGIKHAPTLCIIAETKETACVVWKRRSVSWFFIVFRWGRHDKWDRLGLSLNQCWRFSFSSGFLSWPQLPHFPPLAQCSAITVFISLVSCHICLRNLLPNGCAAILPQQPKPVCHVRSQSVNFIWKINAILSYKLWSCYSMRRQFRLLIKRGALYLPPYLGGKSVGDASFFSSIPRLTHETWQFAGILRTLFSRCENRTKKPSIN